MGDVEVVPPRQVVVSALPLKRRELSVLATQLGSRFRVVDIRDVDEDADVVLCPPCSPQTIARLRSMFPQARVLAVELHDDEAGLHVDGPVGRVLAAGAQGYLLASSGEQIAAFLAPPNEREVEPGRLGALGSASTEDVIIQQLDALAARRAAAESAQPASPADPR
jgi:hypothetical protein